MVKEQKPFIKQVTRLNKLISHKKVSGYKKYFDSNDLRGVFESRSGLCTYCGMQLSSKGYVVNSANFGFRIPIEVGGSISVDNLLLLCPRCKKYKVPRKPVDYPIFGFDAFSDLVVHLVKSVIERDKEKTIFFKAKLDSELENFISSLFYKPLGTPKQLGISYESNRLDMSEIVFKLTLEIEKILKESSLTKTYKSIRNV